MHLYSQDTISKIKLKNIKILIELCNTGILDSNTQSSSPWNLNWIKEIRRLIGNGEDIKMLQALGKHIGISMYVLHVYISLSTILM